MHKKAVFEESRLTLTRKNLCCRELLSLDLADKMKHSLRLIHKAADLAEQMGIVHGVYVGFSGGKDSQVLYDLVSSTGRKFFAVHNLTTIDPPDNIRFIRNQYPYVVIKHPRETFLQLVRRKGMPTVTMRYCCAILKEGDSAGEVVLTGVRADESRKRSAYSETQVRSRRIEHKLNNGRKSLDEILESEHKCVKGKDSVMVYPLLNWTDADIWNYIEFYHLPVNPCYQVSDRVGCMFCPFTNPKELTYYEETYPVWKTKILDAIQQYMDRLPADRKGKFQDAEEYYDWWKSKESVEKWRGKKMQTQLEFEGARGDFPKFDL